ncbi:S9 family peptidase [Negadavirga shengliensis]|uniref:S9 family peptidase n=1 Tax=Negadavirga shengliensis TaxID=1389218 RepID=A0ABV9SZD9_9BACT
MRGIAFFIFLFIHLGAVAQEKRPLTHADYDRWESISGTFISNDGQWVAYQVVLQDGDGRAVFMSHQSPSRKWSVPRGEKIRFSEDGRRGIGLIKAEKDAVRKHKLMKTKKEHLPKDSLFVIDLTSGKVDKHPGVKDFMLPDKNKNWYAYQCEPARGDSVETGGNAPKKSKGKDEKERFSIEVRKFGEGKNHQFHNVSDFGFDEEGRFLYYVQAADDTLKQILSVLELERGETTQVADHLSQYKFPVFDAAGKELVFLGSEDAEDDEKARFSLYHWSFEGAKPKQIAGKGFPGIMEGAVVSPHFAPRFSEDGRRIFFGTGAAHKEFSYEKDTTILDEERVSLDIWGWQDDEIQPMQLKKLNDKKKESFLAVYYKEDGRTVQLADTDMAHVILDENKKSDVVLGWDEGRYRRNYSWDIQIGKDLYAVDLSSGNRVLLEKNAIGEPRMSPGGKYAFWYSFPDSSWMAFDLATRNKITLTANIEENFFNEIHDAPAMPDSYGFAGWTKGDAAFLVYDQFDVWKIDPNDVSRPVNITKGEGRRRQIAFRIENLDEEERYFDVQEPLVLSAFDHKDKKSGYFKGDWTGNKLPQKLVMGDARYFDLRKARHSDKVIYQKSSYILSPDMYASDLGMKGERRMSSINPQQEQVAWGNVELMSFLSNSGETMEGLLFKPEDFDESKKHPMMVYFYERNANGIHLYRPPVPSASIINIPYFVSNGYVVFVPDIKYKVGGPGPSAYDCVVPGVNAVVSRGFVDPERIGIQGQSWGGYQVAYIITKTDMFKAAGAGAPVTNMTSAYGGIRWGTGMSRMFQYEQTQSRIGGTLWEKPMHYIENSPLFFADRINTPVLIMHNDEDGAVPWYQGIEFFMALKRNNIPSWLLVYNDEDHNLKERKNRKDLSIRLSQFFDHYLKEQPAPLWMTEGLPALEKGRTLKYDLAE